MSVRSHSFFFHLNQSLTKASILSYPLLNDKFILDIDANNIQEGENKVGYLFQNIMQQEEELLRLYGRSLKHGKSRSRITHSASVIALRNLTWCWKNSLKCLPYSPRSYSASNTYCLLLEVKDTLVRGLHAHCP